MASMGQLAPGEAQYLPHVHDPLQYQNASTQTDEPTYTGNVNYQHVTHVAQEMEPDVRWLLNSTSKLTIYQTDISDEGYAESTNLGSRCGGYVPVSPGEANLLVSSQDPADNGLR
ncbi:MAG: hypothetical protein Q9160_003019 [Pyrenula sp. 1 TL-2023]